MSTVGSGSVYLPEEIFAKIVSDTADQGSREDAFERLKNLRQTNRMLRRVVDPHIQSCFPGPKLISLDEFTRWTASSVAEASDNRSIGHADQQASATSPVCGVEPTEVTQRRDTGDADLGIYIGRHGKTDWGTADDKKWPSNVESLVSIIIPDAEGKPVLATINFVDKRTVVVQEHSADGIDQSSDTSYGAAILENLSNLSLPEPGSRRAQARLDRLEKRMARDPTTGLRFIDPVGTSHRSTDNRSSRDIAALMYTSAWPDWGGTSTEPVENHLSFARDTLVGAQRRAQYPPVSRIEFGVGPGDEVRRMEELPGSRNTALGSDCFTLSGDAPPLSTIFRRQYPRHLSYYPHATVSASIARETQKPVTSESWSASKAKPLFDIDSLFPEHQGSTNLKALTIVLSESQKPATGSVHSSRVSATESPSSHNGELPSMEDLVDPFRRIDHDTLKIEYKAAPGSSEEVVTLCEAATTDLRPGGRPRGRERQSKLAGRSRREVGL
jgi:hypothetical protein